MRGGTIRVQAAIVGVLAALGCGGRTDPLSGPRPPLQFLWVPKESGRFNPVFQVGIEGAEARAEGLTKSEGVRVKIIRGEPDSAADIAGQAKVVRAAKESGYDGVAVSCNSADGLKDAIDEVSDAGIPVMTFDSDSPDSKRFTYLSGDNEAAGALAAKLLGTAMGERTARRKVALVSGVKGAANLDARIEGFLGALQAVADLVPLAPVYCDDNGEKAANLVERIMGEQPDVGGMFFVGMWPLLTCAETDCSKTMPLWSDAAKNGRVKTVAFDTLPFELGFVKNGLVAGLVGQRCWGWGAESIQILYDHIVRDEQFPKWTDSGIDVVCMNNVKEMEDMWKFERFAPQLSDCIIDGVLIE